MTIGVELGSIEFPEINMAADPLRNGRKTREARVLKRLLAGQSRKAIAGITRRPLEQIDHIANRWNSPTADKPGDPALPHVWSRMYLQRYGVDIQLGPNGPVVVLLDDPESQDMRLMNLRTIKAFRAQMGPECHHFFDPILEGHDYDTWKEPSCQLSESLTKLFSIASDSKS